MTDHGEGERTVALVGLRCAGKTSVGRRLAAALDRPFVDLDDRTAARGEAPSAGELLQAVGLEAFRRLEAEALDDVLDHEPASILATGGGVVETERCRRRLADEADVAWLVVDVAVLGRRLRADPTVRPSLTGADPAEELAALLQRRAPLFREVTTWEIDCRERTVEDIAVELLARVRAPRAD
jgi:shikimate kinase